MKKVLIITSKGSNFVSWQERARYVKSFCENVEKNTQNLKLYFSTYSDITAYISNNNISIYDNRNKLSLDSYDFIQFKNWKGDFKYAAIIAKFLTDNNVKFANQEVAANIHMGKLAQMYIFAKANLNIPNTLYLKTDSLAKITEDQIKNYGFKFPVILKSNDGSRGDDNHLCENAEKVREIANSALRLEDPIQYIIQNFIPNDGDFRFLYIGLDNSPYIFRRKAVKGSHLNNTSKGGEGEIIDGLTLPKTYFKDALTAAKSASCEIVGVDILADKNTYKHYILEVNSTPALATGFMVKDKINKFADYIEKTLDNKPLANIAKSIIGRVENIDLPKLEIYGIPAKIDTGADISTIGVSDLKFENNKISFCFFNKGSQYYTGKRFEFSKGEYTITRVSSSFGHKELRYQLQLSIRLNNRLIKGTFTLSDRSNKLYPILIGRRLLNKKFIVDVSLGKPLKDQERRRTMKLQDELKNINSGM